MAGRGKKRIVTEEEMIKVNELALLNCNDNTICTALGWGHNFLEDRPDIRKLIQQKRAEHRINVRRDQVKHSKNSPVGAIWLGKQVLGQVDRSEITGRDGAALIAPVIQVLPKSVENSNTLQSSGTKQVESIEVPSITGE